MTNPRRRRVPPATRLTPPPDQHQAAFARELCRDVEAIDDPLTLERWASSLLGRTWERRRRHPDAEGHDPGFALGAAMVEAIADVGGQGAAIALAAIAELDDDGVGEHAAAWAAEIGALPIPDWVAKVGRANVTRALVAHSPCVGEAIFIEADQPSFGPHSVAIYIDNQWGGLVTRIGLIPPIEPFAADHAGQLWGSHDLVAVEPELACRRILQAIWLTDERPGICGDSYADLRAIALARVSAGPVPPRKSRARSKR
jgi:hypothetical protein